MACLGYVLSVLPVHDIIDYLNQLLAPHIQQLLQLSQHNVSDQAVSCGVIVAVLVESASRFLGNTVRGVCR